MSDQLNQFLPIVIAILVFAAVVVMVIAFAQFMARARKQRRTRQIDRYAQEARFARKSVDTEEAPSSIIAKLDGVMARRTTYRRKVDRLDNAELPFTPAAWLLIRFAAVVVMVSVFAVLFRVWWIAVILGIFAGWLITSQVIRIRENQRRRAFEEELPEFLELVAGGLRAGLSFLQSLESLAAEGHGQVGRQMRRAVREMHMGQPPDVALMNTADRMDSEDLRWAVTSLSIQQEIGGNLSTILDTVADTIQGRAALRREVRALSAEGRLSIYVLIALPVIVFLFLLLTRPEYVEVFWTEPIGVFLLVLLLALMTVGWFWMRRIVRIRV